MQGYSVDVVAAVVMDGDTGAIDVNTVGGMVVDVSTVEGMVVDAIAVGGVVVDVGVVTAVGTSRCLAVSRGGKLGVKVYRCGVVNGGGMGIAVCLC